MPAEKVLKSKNETLGGDICQEGTALVWYVFLVYPWLEKCHR